jgi:hypothetical protein
LFINAKNRRLTLIMISWLSCLPDPSRWVISQVITAPLSRHILSCPTHSWHNVACPPIADTVWHINEPQFTSGSWTLTRQRCRRDGEKVPWKPVYFWPMCRFESLDSHNAHKAWWFPLNITFKSNSIIFKKRGGRTNLNSRRRRLWARSERRQKDNCCQYPHCRFILPLLNGLCNWLETLGYTALTHP